MLENVGVPAIEKGVQVIHQMSADERTKEMIRMREKALHDEATALEEARAEERDLIAARMRAAGMSESEIIKFVKGV